MNFSGKFPADHRDKFNFSLKAFFHLRFFEDKNLNIRICFVFCLRIVAVKKKKRSGEKMIKVVVEIELENLQGQSFIIRAFPCGVL